MYTIYRTLYMYITMRMLYIVQMLLYLNKINVSMCVFVCVAYLETQTET